ncbi:MFS transporter [Enterovibrio nigricans]|uniref:Drug resistance transporter, EmrB/QacA subfamily n=1 Tax=Enterovibrio nigricans DSM 22720 TaxID=1121868 RepID=A0A1T4UZF1_9GAMM|nr:MFS transporter [Enterovibrio nigricans]PKF50496.1 MFS transporter [Enterovibrio nigricans]SKA58113.1 drug resistance transporter, EmrB/QacA subfamily [Enterovibrio nigricans DSM 22720]
MDVAISFKNKIALATVCLSAVMLGLEITSVPSILPTLKNVLPADFKQLQWIMNAYTIAMCTVLVAMGALADRFGRKRVFVVGVIVFGIASLICGLATSAAVLIAARVLQGLSAAAMLSCQVAILSQQFRSGAERGVAFAWWGVIFGLGLGFGPIVGGAILLVLSWEWIFLIHVLISGITVMLAKFGVEESSDPNAGKIDFWGMVTLSVSVFILVYMITQGYEYGLTSTTGLLLIGVGLVSFSLFVFIEKNVKRPMFDFNAFKIRNFSAALIGACGMNFSFWPFVIYFPIYLQSVLGYDSITTGLTVLALTLPTIVVPPHAEKLLVKRGPSFVIPAGLFTIALGFALIWLVVVTEYASWITLIPGCVLAGTGLGLTNTPVTNTATGSLPPERVGMASGMDFSARMISLAVNIAIMGYVLTKSVEIALSDVIKESVPLFELSRIVNEISAGNLLSGEYYGITSTAAHSALISGFSWVVLYAAIAPLMLGWICAVVSEKHTTSENSCGNNTPCNKDAYTTV